MHKPQFVVSSEIIQLVSIAKICGICACAESQNGAMSIDAIIHVSCDLPHLKAFRVEKTIRSVASQKQNLVVDFRNGRSFVHAYHVSDKHRRQLMSCGHRISRAATNSSANNSHVACFPCMHRQSCSNQNQIAHPDDSFMILSNRNLSQNSISAMKISLEIPLG